LHKWGIPACKKHICLLKSFNCLSNKPFAPWNDAYDLFEKSYSFIIEAVAFTHANIAFSQEAFAYYADVNAFFCGEFILAFWILFLMLWKPFGVGPDRLIQKIPDSANMADSRIFISPYSFFLNSLRMDSILPVVSVRFLMPRFQNDNPQAEKLDHRNVEMVLFW